LALKKLVAGSFADDVVGKPQVIINKNNLLVFNFILKYSNISLFLIKYKLCVLNILKKNK